MIIPRVFLTWKAIYRTAHPRSIIRHRRLRLRSIKMLTLLTILSALWNTILLSKVVWEAFSFALEMTLFLLFLKATYDGVMSLYENVRTCIVIWAVIYTLLLGVSLFSAHAEDCRQRNASGKEPLLDSDDEEEEEKGLIYYCGGGEILLWVKSFLWIIYDSFYSSLKWTTMISACAIVLTIFRIIFFNLKDALFLFIVLFLCYLSGYYVWNWIESSIEGINIKDEP